MTITLQLWMLPLAVYWLVILLGSAHVSLEEGSLVPGLFVITVLCVPTTVVALLTRFL